MTDPRPIGVFDSGVGGLTVLREILRRSPAESTIYLGDNLRAPYGVRPDDEVRAFSIEALDELAARDVKAIVVACNTSTAVGPRRLPAALRPADPRRRPAGAVTAALTTRNRRVGVIATPATVRSHAYFNAIKDENPAVEVYEHATPAFVPLVEAGRLAGAEVERSSRTRSPRCSASATKPASSSSRCPPRRGSTRSCSAAPTTRCSGRSSPASPGSGVAIVDSATATASALVELLAINGLEAPGSGDDRGSDDSTAAPAPATHRQLTTGDVGAFRTVAERIFGEAFPEVESVEVAAVVGSAARQARQGARSHDRPDSHDVGHDTGHAPLRDEPPARRAEPDRLGRPAWRDDRVWQAGFLVGSAIGAAATVLGRGRAGGPPGPRRLARRGARGDRPAPEQYVTVRR